MGSGRSVRPRIALDARHPLAALRHRRNHTAQQYLQAINERHIALGHGAMAIHRKKISLWESGTVTPEQSAQLAIASLEGLPEEIVHRLPWPEWLLHALDDEVLLYVPWTPEGARHALTDTSTGGTMDRRGFLIATGTTLGLVAADWLTAITTSSKAYPRIGAEEITHFEARMAELRRLDDELGSGVLRDAAGAEVGLLATLINETSHSPAVERTLYSYAAEASRFAGWVHYDSGHYTAADRFYITAMHASAAGGDVLVGANNLAFMAVQHYTVADPADAVDLLDIAHQSLRSNTSPKTSAIVHARTARAHAKMGDRGKCDAALDAAFSALTTTGHEPSWAYWVTPTELDLLAGSCHLDLGDPRRALVHFTAALCRLDTTQYPASAAIYLARAAQAHLRLGDIDAAAALATQAVDHHSSITSARSDTTINELRNALAHYRSHPVAVELTERLN